MAKNWHCSNCGSTNTTVSATARWDVAKQEWVLDGVDDTSDNDLCLDCEDWVAGEFRDVADLKTAATVAIKQNEVA